MEQFHVERKGNRIFVNREPETIDELQDFEDALADAFVYAFLSDNQKVEEHRHP